MICKTCKRRTNVIDCRPSIDGAMKVRKRICYGCDGITRTVEVEEHILRELGLKIPKQMTHKYIFMKKEVCNKG